jgi:hypothetical protein
MPMMAYFMPGHRNVLRHGSSIAERIVCKEMCWNVEGIYDIKTLAEFDNEEPKNGVFAQLLRIDPERTTLAPHRYRVCLQDTEILNFVQRNAEIDMLSFITFIMTHELLHINRFVTGKADFFGDPHDEEFVVDTLTRLFLAKNPVIGLKKVLALLDKVEAAPLYNEHIVNDGGKCINAYL